MDHTLLCQGKLKHYKQYNQAQESVPHIATSKILIVHNRPVTEPQTDRGVVV